MHSYGAHDRAKDKRTKNDSASFVLLSPAASPFEALGLSYDDVSSEDIILRAWRRKMRGAHPDKASCGEEGEEKEKATEQAAALNELKDQALAIWRQGARGRRAKEAERKRAEEEEERARESERQRQEEALLRRQEEAAEERRRNKKRLEERERVERAQEEERMRKEKEWRGIQARLREERRRR